MATTTFCDWCGELLDVPAGKDAPEVKVAGYGSGRRGVGEHFMFTPLAGGFNIHAEIDGDEIDPNCCLGSLEALLRERANWAHDPDQEATEWRLVPREGRSLTTGEKLRAARELEAAHRQSENAEVDARHYRWKALPTGERLDMIRGLLADGKLTIRETAEALEAEFPEIRVYESRIRPLMAKLYEAGELKREGERWREGDGPGCIRYRYMLAEGEQA